MLDEWKQVELYQKPLSTQSEAHDQSPDTGKCLQYSRHYYYPLSFSSPTIIYLKRLIVPLPPSLPSAAARIEKRLSYCSSPASPPPFIFPPAPFSLLPTTVLLSRTDLLSTVLSDINYIAQQGRLAKCHGHYLE